MEKLVQFFFIIALVVGFFLSGTSSSARQYSAIIVDEITGKVLHAEYPDVKTYPASLAKIMTLYLLFEQLQAGRFTMLTKLKVSAQAAARPPSKLGLRVSRFITVRSAIGALITKSANDVATVVAEAISGTETQFAILMTKRARELGMKATNFRNASGLPDRRQVTTARDMARLSIAIRRDFPKYYNVFALKRFRFGRRNYRNHNNLLSRFPGTTGIKTGYINASGYNLAVSIERNGKKLIGIIFGGKTPARRDNRMIALLHRTLTMISQHEQIVQKHNLSRSQKILQAGQMRAPLDTDREGWGIQIGAFSRFAQAFLAANQAVEASEGLRWARISVEKSIIKNKRLYRARLVDISKHRAIRACIELQTKRVSCQVVQVGPIPVGDRSKN